jgi:hypothetical protein
VFEEMYHAVVVDEWLDFAVLRGADDTLDSL